MPELNILTITAADLIADYSFNRKMASGAKNTILRTSNSALYSANPQVTFRFNPKQTNVNHANKVDVVEVELALPVLSGNGVDGYNVSDTCRGYLKLLLPTNITTAERAEALHLFREIISTADMDSLVSGDPIY